MEQLNNLLSKTRFAITERLDMADIMVGYQADLTYNDWLVLLNKTADSLYIQSKYKKLHMKIEDDLYELYFIEKLERHDYFKILELCSSPIKVTLKDIQEHSYTQMDSYFGVSSNIEALNPIDLEHDIFYIEPFEYIHDPINTDKVDLDSISIIEERQDYIYFKIDDLFFEAKELVGSFDVYCGSKNIFTAKNKNDVLKQAKSHLDIINNQKKEEYQ